MKHSCLKETDRFFNRLLQSYPFSPHDFFLTLSIKSFLKDLPEMKSVDRKGNGMGKKAGTPDRSPEQQPPILEAFFSNDPEDDN